MLFAKILPRAQRACTFDISADRNVWLQPALRSFAIVCDYMETALFAIVCDLRSAIVCDHMETSLYSEKFVHPNLARLIELGGAKIKYLINIFTMTKITKGNNYYLRQERVDVSMRYYSGIQIEILVN